jgi:hypothetical protein
MNKSGTELLILTLTLALVQMPGLAASEHTYKDEARAIAEPDSKKSILQAVAAIKKQTEEGHTKARDDGMTRAGHVLKQCNQITHHIRLQREDDISTLGFRAVRASAFYQEQEAEIRYQAMVRENAVRQNARLEAARHVRLAAERAQALESAAANLESQLLEGPKRSGVRLTALGTNLYVRNYVSYVEPPVELVATPMVATTGRYRNKVAGKTTTSVRGKILVPSPAR